MMNPEIVEALRWLVLPVQPTKEADAMLSAIDAMTGLGIAASDQAAWLREQREAWAVGSRSPELEQVIQAFIRVAHPTHGAIVVVWYFRLYQSLITKFGMTHDSSRRLLNHIFLIFDLATHEKMAASQIALLLEMRDASLGSSWREVKHLLTKLGVVQDLAIAAVQDQYATDSADEVTVFADSSFAEVSEILSVKAANLGFPVDMKALLDDLFTPGAVPDCHAPYLLILHHQCAALAFYDASPSFLYEFSPRGQACLWLLAKYPFSGAGNAFLNNAKAVERCDITWARSKEDHLPRAKALATIFSGLEKMGFASKRELAMWLRRWLTRIVKAKTGAITLVPHAPIDRAQCLRVLNGAGAVPTNTRGIIEQRLNDVVSCLLHPASAGWHARGLGDSVNATNTSTKKIGDCDFQHATNRDVVGYETHAGKLSKIYFEEHLRTLANSLPQRIAEWQIIDDSAPWTAKVIFIAYDFEMDLPPARVICGINVTLEYVTFQDFFALILAQPDPLVISAFQSKVHSLLNEARTPQFVRDVYASLM